METIEIGQYKLPEGCVAKVKDGILTIRESHKAKVTESRCRDCEYFETGHAVRGCPWYVTKVCTKKPKTKKDIRGNTVYMTANPYGKICDNFKLKEKNESTSTEQP